MRVETKELLKEMLEGLLALLDEKETLPAPWRSPFLPLPLKKKWEENMVTFGAAHAAFLANSNNTFDSRLAAHYYDSTWVFFQIADYTNDPVWLTRAESANAVYSKYLLDAKGKAQGFRVFPRGLEESIQRNSSATSRARLESMNLDAAYTGENANATTQKELEGYFFSRENAYALNTKLTMLALGYQPSPRIPQLVKNALSHLQQWFGPRPTATFVRPFMWALTCRSLIRYLDYLKDDKILPAILESAEIVWRDYYLPDKKALKYTNVDTSKLPATDPAFNTGGTQPEPDLDLMILPVFGWLYHQTGDKVWIERGDLLFEGGVTNSFFGGSKQFNQCYTWSFDYVKWREAKPVTER